MPAERPRNPFGPFSDPLVATAALAIWFVLLLRFQSAPELDLAAARWFFDAAACAASERAGGQYCEGFTLGAHPLLSLVREALHPLPVALGIVMLVAILVQLGMGKRWRDAGIRVQTVLVSTLVLGPGLVVNGILKAHWGRPRPWMTEDFGGWLSFVEAGVKTDLCSSNCSFVSGEAATAGWLMCLALVLAVRRYAWPALAIGTVSVFMAGLRVAFGAHYLSDAVLGYTMTVAIFVVLAAIAEWSVSRRDRNPDSACAIEETQYGARDFPASNRPGNTSK
ncbi:phosphatase PAP2 family protein [Oricola thermophila]|uniref:Phosphatase PAP2 family protein n=1 Tax=Oricola thermophila TaxID=2742145 RepID=A0A6N1VGN2_9HYPH|nr:phosphatase PAP2 family protein [Oricola thermophila]QKV19928.1 phosphatase PAP2 family protein [Oricola thermophila]